MATTPKPTPCAGLNYLTRSLQAADGNARLALAGYNGGIGVIARSEWNWPAQTKRYVYYGAPIYADAINGATSSSMLDEWYRKYGAGVMQQTGEVKIGIELLRQQRLAMTNSRVNR